MSADHPDTSSPEQHMRRAIDLARRGEGRTAPNPPVGAVLTRDGMVVGDGWHPAAGEPHAEIFALRAAGERARGADLYVTLEPCCHHGRTGPCTEALIDAGVRRVIYGTLDPNPKVAGQGVARLQNAGLEVTAGPFGDECRRLIAPFAKHVTTGRPYLMLKAAMTLDGQLATSGGASQWISGDASRMLVHHWRDRVDGILTGAGTVVADDPRLTTRLPDGGRNPARIVIDSQLRSSAEALVYASSVAGRRLLVTAAGHHPNRLEPFVRQGVEVITVPASAGRLDLVAVMAALGERNLQSLLVEAGGGLNGALLRAGLVDCIRLFVAPLLLGGNDGRPLFSGEGVIHLADALRLRDMRVSRVGDDVLIEGELVSCSPD